jgi:hypothetical protein
VTDPEGTSPFTLIDMMSTALINSLKTIRQHGFYMWARRHVKGMIREWVKGKAYDLMMNAVFGALGALTGPAPRRSREVVHLRSRKVDQREIGVVEARGH